MSARYYDIHGLVHMEVDTRVGSALLDAIDFQVGYFRTSTPPSDINLAIRPFKKRPTYSGTSQFHNYTYFDQYLEQDNRNFAVLTKKDGFVIYAENSPFLVNIYLQILLSRSNVSFIHAAGISKENEALVLAGGGGVGKTALASNLVKRDGYCWLGDDLICLSKDGQCLSFPRSFVLKEYHRDVYPKYFDEHDLKRRSAIAKIRAGLIRFAYANAPFMGIFESLLRRLGVYQETYSAVGRITNDRYVAAPSIEDLFGSEAIVDEGTLGNFVFMERHNNSVFEFDSLSKESLINRLLAVIHHEWVDYMREFYTLGATEMFDISKYFTLVIEILESSVPSDGGYLFKIPTNCSPDDLYEEFRRKISS